VARLVELLLLSDSKLQLSTWSPLEMDKRVPLIGLERFHSTTIRLITFLAIREQFRMKTARSSSPLLDKVRFYIDRKIPPAFKGNIFASELLSTEDAEVIGEYFARVDEGREIGTLGILEKLETVRGIELFNHVGGRLSVDIPELRKMVYNNTIDDTDSARHILALAHLTLMLIDFQQNIEKGAQWEEYRIVLCKLLQKHNTSRDKRTFLYRRGDINERSYLDSYGEHVTRASLNWRGKKGRHSHPTKVISSDGVHAFQGKSKSRQEIHLRWADDLETLVRALNTFLCSTRKLVAIKTNISVPPPAH